jgi:hypothetical protein
MISIGTLFKNSWLIYRMRFKTIVGVLAPGILFQFFLFLEPPAPTLLGSMQFIIGLWIALAILYVVKEKDTEMSSREALGKGIKRLFSYWWLNVLSLIIAIGGFLLFVVPGVILSIWFSLASYVFVAEDRKGMTALLRSKQLVQGYWLQVFWRLLVLGLLAILTIAPFIILGVVLTLAEVATSVALEKSMGLIVGLSQWFVSAFGIAYGYLLYENLRDIKKDVPFEEPTTKRKLKFLAVGIPTVFIILAVFAFLGSVSVL